MSQSINRMSKEGDACKTVCENSEIYLSHRCRKAIGSEAIQIQGAHFGPHHVLLAGIDDSCQRKLGGDAFHVWSATISVLTSLVLLSEGAASARQTAQPLLSSANVSADATLDESQASSLDAAECSPVSLGALWSP